MDWLAQCMKCLIQAQEPKLASPAPNEQLDMVKCARDRWVPGAQYLMD